MDKNEIIYEELSDNYRYLRNRLIKRTLICIFGILITLLIVILVIVKIHT